MPEGEKNDSLVNNMKQQIATHIALAIRIDKYSWRGDVTVEVYNRFRFVDGGYILLTQDWEYFAEQIYYDESLNIWIIPE